jgi:hypothetical protein
MPKLGTLVEKLFKKVGIDTSIEELKPLFELDTEVADENFNLVDRNLMSIDAAKNSPVLLKHFRHSLLSPADSTLNDFIAENEITVGEDFANEKSTYSKIGMLLKTVLDSGKKAGGAGNKQTADEFAQKEAAYNKTIKELKDAALAQENNYNTSRENDLTAFELKTILSGKNYIFPAEMDTNLKLNTALGAVQNELTKKGFSVKRNEAGQLTIVNKEGQPAYNDTNEAIEPNTFIDGALAQNKLLKINDASQQQSAASNGTQTITSTTAQGNSNIVAEIEAQLAEFK